MEKGRITSDLIGAYVCYKYCGILIPRARIQYEGGTYYLCQDYHPGAHCSNKYGFTHSHAVGDGSKAAGEREGVTELTLLPESYHLLDGKAAPSVTPADRPADSGDKFKLKESLFVPEKLPKLDQFN